MDEVVALLRRMLQPGAASSAACAAGSFASSDGGCTPCAPGSYAPDSWPRAACTPCLAGRVAPRAGAVFCATCPDGTRSVDGVRCKPCPNGTVGCVLRGRIFEQRAALTWRVSRRVILSSAEGRAPAEQACARLPALPQAVQRLLNESRAFEPLQDEAAEGAAAPSRGEDLAEQLLYEVQALDLPARRRLLPRAYGFAAPLADNSSSAAAASAVPAASPPTRGVFGWPSGWRADAAAASCICLAAAAAAGAAFALGARRRQVSATAAACLRLLVLTHCHRSVLLMRLRPGLSASATAMAGALGLHRRATARTTAAREAWRRSQRARISAV